MRYPGRKEIRRRAVDKPLPGVHPVLGRVYAARGVSHAAELDASLARLISPARLDGLDEALDLMQEAVEANARMLIVGDFDADGATSCAVGVLGLRQLGAEEVGYLVPNRFGFGYGLTPEIVEVAALLTPAPDLLITVDNGIGSLEGVRAAHERGMSVLVTDHHLPGRTLPQADAIVNPKLPGSRFPSPNLAGVGVIYYVLLALRARLRESGWFSAGGRPEPNFAGLLDLVALGTVADLVPLDRNNRILVAQGLKRINAGQCRPGIRALLEKAGRRPGRIAASDLSFGAAPRLNAAGRLEDMSLGIECLLADDPSAAMDMAGRLDNLNGDRRAMEKEMNAQALAEVERLCAQAGELPKAFCLYDPGWHQGIVGLIASRVRERLNRPTVAFAPGESGELKGSARSVEGLHIRDLLEAVDAERPQLITRYGGHAMAAGLSLPPERLEEFREAFLRLADAALTDEQLAEVLYTDGALDEEYISLEFADTLRDAGPWGQGFPEPRFDGEFEVLDRLVVNDAHVKFRLRQKTGGRVVDAWAFRSLRNGEAAPACNRLRAVYRLEANEYEGLRTPRLIIDYFEPL